jgi:hypothetical protein
MQILGMAGMRSLARSILYFPIEGLPVSTTHARGIQQFDYPVTYCNFGRVHMKELYNLDVDNAAHGFDHGPFAPEPEDLVRQVRKVINFNDKFIVGMVGVNKRTNRYPVLLKAMEILLERGYDDIFMYLHTTPYDVFKGEMAGWALGDLKEIYNTRDKHGKSHIIFPPEYNDGGRHVYRGIKYKVDMKEALEIKLPDDLSAESVKASTFAALGYIARLNVLDMYIDVASAHGWNLPLGEALKCGIPGATVNDGFARTEIYCDTNAAYPMETSGVPDYWHTGGELPLVSAETVADTIMKFYHDSDLRRKYADRGKQFVDSLLWKPTTDMFVEAARSLV